LFIHTGKVDAKLWQLQGKFMVCSKPMENINELLRYFKETDIEEIMVIVEWILLATCVANIGESFRVIHFPMIC